VNPSPETVHDTESAVRFIKWCVEEIGLGYHPDTPFADYVDGDGRPSFSAADATRLEELANRAFEFCDPYQVGHDEFQRLLARSPGGPQTI
jgi:hypothetical protein